MTLFEPSARAISLIRLASLIAAAAADIGVIAVEGEVHRPSTGPSRQWFTLRDRAAQVTVSVPAGRRARCRVVAGERVSVTGRLEWVPGSGQLQLEASEVVPVGEGAMAAMISAARQRLVADGLTSRPRRPISRLPTTIGVICGREAAVRADIESVVAARFPGYPVLFVETTVSGPGAADNIIAAITRLDGRPDVDVIVLARGGGDATQLLPFSDEALCRAVCATTTPVVSAIGHDGDRPLVDEVADLRCGTPSLAAAAVVPSFDALASELLDLWRGVCTAAFERVEGAGATLAALDVSVAGARGLERATSRLVHASSALELVHPARAFDRALVTLGRIDWRGPASARLGACDAALAGLAAHASALSPVRVLERGYAVVRRTADGVVVRDPAQAASGTALDVQVAAGTMAAVVR